MSNASPPKRLDAARYVGSSASCPSEPHACFLSAGCQPLLRTSMRRQVAADPAPSPTSSEDKVAPPPAAHPPKRRPFFSPPESPFTWQGRLYYGGICLLHAAFTIFAGHPDFAVISLILALIVLFNPVSVRWVPG